MLYISTSCVKHDFICESVQELINNGFQNIELSGGTKYYPQFEHDLLSLKDKYKLNFLCHNYFPPPKESFVINLASLNDVIYDKSIRHIKSAISLSKKLGATRFGFHAGFYFDPKVHELGKKISASKINNKTEVIKRFKEAYLELISFESDINLYLENNVLSHENYRNFRCNPNMLTNTEDYNELKTEFNFKLLLDVAHLKVTCKTLGLNFENELMKLIGESDYIHISDNNGFHDSNNSLNENSELLNILKKQDLMEKDITIEVYEGMSEIKKTYELLTLHNTR